MQTAESSISKSSRSTTPTSQGSSSSERMSLLKQKEGPYKYDSLPFAHGERGPRISTNLCSQGWNELAAGLRRFKFLGLLPSILVGTLIWYLIAPGDELNETAIRVLAVFVSTIIALLTAPYDMSVIVLLALAVLSVTKSFTCQTADGLIVECSMCGYPKNPSPLRSPSILNLYDDSDDVYDCDGYGSSFSQALDGYSNEINWLVFAAFHLGRAVEITALGQRVSLEIIHALGWAGVLGLGYAIVASELLLGPFVPSNTARGGGIIKPVATSIARALDSTPERNPAAGRFLMLVGAHANLISASFYLTAMAANPLILSKSRAIFPHLDLGFLTWLEGSSVPGLVTLAVVPLFLRVLVFGYNCGQQADCSYDKGAVVRHASVELRQLGNMSIKEKKLCLILLACLVLWITGSWIALDPTLVAFCAIILLVLTDTISWNDVATNHKAWDTFIWLGGLITLADALVAEGVSHFLGHRVSWAVARVTTDPIPAAVILALLYFLSTFAFSSLSAHIVAFASVFMTSGAKLRVPPMAFVAMLGYFSSLAGSMTNFSTGTVAMYFAEGYSTPLQWFTAGALVSVIHLGIYLTIGMGWWWMLGWF